MSERDALAAELALRMGDNALVLGQRLCGWIGAAHDTEEDLAQANTALDLMGQARAWLTAAGELDGTGRTEDELAYLRDEGEFRNAILVEQPNGDFAATVCRQLLFDAWHVPMLYGLRDSASDKVQDIAATAHREAAYHLRHSAAWFARLADGTKESRDRILTALDQLWPLCGELLVPDNAYEKLERAGISPEIMTVASGWRDNVAVVFAGGKVEVPSEDLFVQNLAGRKGRHSEHLGPLLAVMQEVARKHPGASW